MTFAKELLELREQLGWTQSAVGELVPGGATAQSVGRWERGEARPKAAIQKIVLAGLRRAIQADVDSDHDRQFAVEIVQPSPLSDGLASLGHVLVWLGRLSVDQRRIALNSINASMAEQKLSKPA